MTNAGETSAANLVLGVIGCGRMGTAAVNRLLAEGIRVVAFDADVTARTRIAGLGVETARTAREVGAAADLVLLSLPHGGAVRAALAGADGLLTGPTGPHTIVDLSTIAVTEADGIRAVSEARSSRYVSCPVIGGVTNCGAWTLLVDSAELAPDAITVLSHLGRLENLGEPGAGLKIKLVANMLLATSAASLMEALDVARASGVSLQLLHRVLTDSRTVAVGPLFTNVLSRVLAGEQVNSFGIGLLLKDAGLAAELGVSHGQVTPILEESVRDIRRRAVDYDSTVDFASLLRGSRPTA